ncbi:MAG: DUF4173 domain-containing protein [Bacteroidota bacterium]|nr:DUF4173 domain-containing protein [Bacteroidota bacterium]
MKTNDYLLITATIGYSYLFFEQNAGINFLVFNLLLIISFLIKNKQLIKQKKWLWAAGMVLISGTNIFVHSSSLSIIANCISLVLLSAFTLNTKTSAIFSFLFSGFSICSSFVFVIIDAITRSQNKADREGNTKKGYKFIAISLVLILCILFFVIYKNANPLFAENTKWINLDFISFKWVAFTLGGFVLVYALLYHKTIPIIEKWENELPLINTTIIGDNTKRFETERFSGMILFIFLNLMLLILNFGDITSIWFKAALPKGVSHSDFVHNGVGMIILSIIIATSLLMFLFRKDFNSIKNSKLLKALILIWVIQNLIMLFSTVCRNQIYIESYNFTYRRIGVYVWLLLAAVGLVIVSLKIIKEKSNWYLVKTNFAVWFSVLVISSTVNWDILITKYNISNKPLKDVDFYYLFSLSDSNIPELIEATKNHDFPKLNSRLKNYTNNVWDDYYNEDFNTLLHNKINSYLHNYTNDWQSFDLRDVRIINSLTKY